MQTLRVGFVGFGFIGKVHAYGYLNLPLYYPHLAQRVRITHVCTASPDSAARAALQTGAAHGETDYRRVTENPDVDIVHICTPNHLHRDALLSAMAHQKHIYCDKPLTATLAEAAEVEAALPAYRGISQMTLQNRFFPTVLRARQMIEEGFLGQVLQFRAAYLHGGSADPGAPLGWKLDAAAGGGVVADLGPHVLDLVHHLLGDFENVQALTATAYADRPSPSDPARRVAVTAEDAMLLLARMRSGGVGVVEATKLALGAEDEMRVEIHGSAGAIRFNGMDPHHLGIYDASAAGQPIGGRRGWTAIDTGQRYPAPASGFPGPKFAMGWLRGHLACLAAFLQGVVDGTPVEPSLRHGVLIQRWIETVRESARTGLSCRLPSAGEPPASR